MGVVIMVPETISKKLRPMEKGRGGGEIGRGKFSHVSMCHVTCHAQSSSFQGVATPWKDRALQGRGEILSRVEKLMLITLFLCKHCSN